MSHRNSRRHLLLALASVGSGLATQLLAQSARIEEGRHYKTLGDNALSRSQAASTLPLVTEIFWYGCPGCHAFDPLLNQWVADQGATIAFSRSPTVWNAATQRHARLFHAARELGILDAVHEEIFSAIHEQRNSLLDEDAQRDFLVAHNITAAAADKALQSFAVDAELRKAEALQRELKVPGIPALIVQGRYLVTIDSGIPSYTRMLEVVEQLLAAA